MKTNMMMLGMLFLIGFVFSYMAFAESKGALKTQINETMENATGSSMDEERKNMENIEIATFAGGCFWCTESDFEKIEGVKEVVSGYTGGDQPDPTYNEVSGGSSGHTEAIQVYYDADKVTYRELLDVFWRHVNPTDPNGQFVDRGSQYRSEIFFHNEMQREQAEASKKALAASMVFDKPIVTPITKLETFYKAEEYHQDYYKKSPSRYKYYRWGSGRDQFLEKAWKGKTINITNAVTENTKGVETTTWSKPSEMEIQQKLAPLQFNVTQENGTEPPFNNEYWDNKAEGIYVDIVSGEPLFSSRDKFKSGTGWPSFTRPLESENVVEKTDKSLFMVRTEVKSKFADSHLGHLFDDGPAPTGLRYCINSAALKFIPKEKLKEEGLGQYLEMFEQ